MLGKIDKVIEIVSKKLPSDFPVKIYEPIFEGMLLARKKLFL
jgi:hypothetical protein